MRKSSRHAGFEDGGWRLGVLFLVLVLDAAIDSRFVVRIGMAGVAEGPSAALSRWCFVRLAGSIKSTCIFKARGSEVSRTPVSQAMVLCV